MADVGYYYDKTMALISEAEADGVSLEIRTNACCCTGGEQPELMIYKPGFSKEALAVEFEEW